jgi:hypothetical protein
MRRGGVDVNGYDSEMRWWTPTSRYSREWQATLHPQGVTPPNLDARLKSQPPLPVQTTLFSATCTCPLVASFDIADTLLEAQFWFFLRNQSWYAWKEDVQITQPSCLALCCRKKKRAHQGSVPYSCNPRWKWRIVVWGQPKQKVNKIPSQQTSWVWWCVPVIHERWR